MRAKRLAQVGLLALGLGHSGAMAQDAEAGAQVFGKCKACHRIESGTNVIVKGGRTGPNLWGVVGRQIGGLQDFNYSPGFQAVFGQRIDWTEALLAEYLANPTEFVKKYSGDDAARSKMTFKLTEKEAAANVAAYLASLAGPTETPPAAGSGG